MMKDTKATPPCVAFHSKVEEERREKASLFTWTKDLGFFLAHLRGFEDTPTGLRFQLKGRKRGFSRKMIGASVKKGFSGK
jgi:hypothetical protein